MACALRWKRESPLHRNFLDGFRVCTPKLYVLLLTAIRRARMKLTLTVFFSLLFISLVAGLITVLKRSPLFPFQFENLSWLQDWLLFTVVDFYGVAIPFCTIILATEGWIGVAWSLGVLLLGSPVAAVYMVYRLRKGQLSMQPLDPYVRDTV